MLDLVAVTQLARRRGEDRRPQIYVAGANGKLVAMGTVTVRRLAIHGLEFDPVAFAVVCGIYAAVVVLHWHHTYPIDDEIAFVPATISDAWAGWVTQGFSEYFRPYDSWSVAAREYIKPIDNLAFWLVHEVCSGLSFRDCFLVYILLYCAAVFFGARLIYHCAVGLGVRERTARMASWLYLLNPAVLNGLDQYTNQFDTVAGIFAMAAFCSLRRGSTVATLGYLLLGVFTKEIVLTAPIAAAVSCWLLERRLAKGLLMLLPLGVWTSLYLATFGWSSLIGHGTGFTSFAQMPLLLVRGICLWPLGVADGRILHDIAVGNAPFDLKTFWQYALVAMNLFLWFALASIVWVLARQCAALSVGSDAKKERPLAYAMIWLFCALAMGVVAAQGTARYGGWIYPSMLIAGVAWWNAPSLQTATTRIAAALASALFVLAFGYADVDWYLNFKMIPEPAVAELHDTLLSLGGEPSIVYVVNGPPGVYATPKLLRQAWRLPFDVRLVSMFDGCLRGEGGSLTTDDRIMRITIPDCATMDFSVDVSPETLLTAVNGYAHRDGIGDYHFADGRVTGHAIRDPAHPIIDVGRRLTVRLDPNLTTATFIYYDWDEGKYQISRHEQRFDHQMTPPR